MKNFIVTTAEMKQYDKNTIEQGMMAEAVLMERAAMAIFQEMLLNGLDKSEEVLVIAGPGNNGGDGVAAARIAHENGYQVLVYVVGEKTKYSKGLQLQLQIAEKMKVPFISVLPANKRFGMILDAIFGIGLTRDITEPAMLEAISFMNDANSFLISVDVPTGIHTDSGRIMGAAVKADVTVTFGFFKLGCALFPGKKYAGEVKIEKIGITEYAFADKQPKHFGLTDDFYLHMPKRDAAGNKGTFGKVLVIAGSNQMIGAAILVAKAAFRSGCGMVKVITSEEAARALHDKVPEVMTTVVDTVNYLKQEIEAAVSWADSVVIGPGMGTDAFAMEKMKVLFNISSLDIPVVVDADGINLLSMDETLKEKVLSYKKVILTPHIGELSRLLQRNIIEVKEHFDEALLIKEQYPSAVFVCKDAVTRVVSKEEMEYINLCGNDGMATAGSGDVLSGIVGAFCCISASTFQAAVLAVYLHSLAGDKAAKEKGIGMMASDMIRKIEAVLSDRKEQL